MTEAVTAFQPDVSTWDPWTPGDVLEVFARVEAPWYVAGGWAIDLFLGGARRQHDDVEVAVPAARFGEIAGALAEYDLCVVKDGEATPLDTAGSALAGTHQTWVRDRGTGSWRLDLFREPSDGDTWIYRRDERIRCPYSTVIERTDDGIPYGRPEVVLLFKSSRATEAKHEDDFAAVLPRLDAHRRRWLADALELTDPGHRWRGELES
jgi:Aminoglycoside-2''-adenylyltransferase